MANIYCPKTCSWAAIRFSLHDETIDLSRSFTVAEYRKPEFQVTLVPEKEEALRGEAVDVTLEATYFFGGSAADLDVNWTIYEETYRPDVLVPLRLW